MRGWNGMYSLFPPHLGHQHITRNTITQLIPRGSQTLAVATPRRVELDEHGTAILQLRLHHTCKVVVAQLYDLGSDECSKHQNAAQQAFHAPDQFDPSRDVGDARWDRLRW